MDGIDPTAGEISKSRTVSFPSQAIASRSGPSFSVARFRGSIAPAVGFDFVAGGGDPVPVTRLFGAGKFGSVNEQKTVWGHNWGHV